MIVLRMVCSDDAPDSILCEDADDLDLDLAHELEVGSIGLLSLRSAKSHATAGGDEVDDDDDDDKLKVLDLAAAGCSFQALLDLDLPLSSQ